MKKQLVINSENLSDYLDKNWIVKMPYEHAGVKCGYIIEKNEDNPVPSLYKLLAEKVGAQSVEYEQICEIINGVETDKEKPKNCFCKNNDKTCINCY